MFRIFISALLFLMCSVATNAQSTKEKARAMFKNGEYAEAKPLFESLLKRSPKDGSYNFWYAACCFETNDTVADIEKMLRYAVTRRVNEAHRYLGDFYKRDYRYDEAVACYEEYIDGCNDDDVIATYEELCEHLKRLQRMMKMTERVCVVDSFVVDKNKFLSVYRTGRDIGTLAFAADYFKKPEAAGTVAVTERGTDLYFSQTYRAWYRFVFLTDGRHRRC